MVFGLTNLVLCIFLKFSMKLSFRVFCEEEFASVAIPFRKEIELQKQKIWVKFPDLGGTAVIQNAYYNGWLHDNSIERVFVFGKLGVVIECTSNAPGSWHHSFIAEIDGLQTKCCI